MFQTNKPTQSRGNLRRGVRFAMRPVSCGSTHRSSCWKRSTRCCRCPTATRARASAVTGLTSFTRRVSGGISRSDGERSHAARCAPPTFEPSSAAATTSLRSTTGDSRCTSESSDTTAVASLSNPSNTSTISSSSYGQVLIYLCIIQNLHYVIPSSILLYTVTVMFAYSRLINTFTYLVVKYV